MKIAQNYCTITPAIGRDYTSKNAAIPDFEAGKDFIESVSRKYVSKRDFVNGVIVNIRYNKLTRVTPVTVINPDSIDK